MALQVSGAISFLDIRNEFGGTNPVNISNYYRGGALVPDIDANSNIPSSGTITLNNFYGGRTLRAIEISDSSQNPKDICSLIVTNVGYFEDDSLKVGTKAYADQIGKSPLDDGYYTTEFNIGIEITSGEISSTLNC